MGCFIADWQRIYQRVFHLDLRYLRLVLETGWHAPSEDKINLDAGAGPPEIEVHPVDAYFLLSPNP
jgi:hypothetical protein